MNAPALPAESLRLARLTARGLAYRWTHAFTGCVVTWVISNGVEVSAQSLPWAAVAEAFKGAGISWKGALIQAAVHATWNGIIYLNRSTGRETSPPFGL